MIMKIRRIKFNKVKKIKSSLYFSFWCFIFFSFIFDSKIPTLSMIFKCLVFASFVFWFIFDSKKSHEELDFIEIDEKMIQKYSKIIITIGRYKGEYSFADLIKKGEKFSDGTDNSIQIIDDDGINLTYRFVLKDKLEYDEAIAELKKLCLLSNNIVLKTRFTV